MIPQPSHDLMPKLDGGNHRDEQNGGGNNGPTTMALPLRTRTSLFTGSAKDCEPLILWRA
jgi:hypothetical protein